MKKPFQETDIGLPKAEPLCVYCGTDENLNVFIGHSPISSSIPAIIHVCDRCMQQGEQGMSCEVDGKHVYLLNWDMLS